MKQSTKDFLAFAVLPVVGVFGATYLLNKKGGPRSGNQRAGWNTIMCSPYQGHSVCVLQSQYDLNNYSFAVDDGPAKPNGWGYASPQAARDGAERFIDDMT